MNSKSHTVLPIAQVLVTGQRGVTKVNMLFDTGSDRSYIYSSLVKRSVLGMWLLSMENTPLLVADSLVCKQITSAPLV